jgi:antitoxin component YwqK of YwqJK toxin-antitoxin module
MDQYIPTDLIKYIICSYVPHYIITSVNDKNMKYDPHRTTETVDYKSKDINVTISADDKIISYITAKHHYHTTWHAKKVVEIKEFYHIYDEYLIKYKTEIYKNQVLTKKLEFYNDGIVYKKTIYKNGFKSIVKTYKGTNLDLVSTEYYSIIPHTRILIYDVFVREYYDSGYYQNGNVWPKHYLKSERKFIITSEDDFVYKDLNGTQYKWNRNGKITLQEHYVNGKQKIKK